MSSTTLTIPSPDDFHGHLRDLKNLLPHVLGFTAAVFARMLVMPNTDPKIKVAQQALDYKQDILTQAAVLGHGAFKPLMTLYLTDDTTTQMIREASEAGVIAAKVYPRGVTTNSDEGVLSIPNLYPVFETMQAEQMVLCLHGQTPGNGVRGRDREVTFLSQLCELARDFPRLRIVLEHLSTFEAVHTVRTLSANVAATITAHHLVLTRDDVDDVRLQPYHFCLPCPNTPRDREAIRWAATSGSGQFFFGSDSAPHLPHAKEHEGKGGVFSAPVALPVLAQVFEEMGALDKLADFTSKFGAQFYGLPQNTGTVTLVKKPWLVPSAYPGGPESSPGSYLVPLYAGKMLEWQVQK